MLAKSKLNSIETLVSKSLIDMEVSHNEFIIILKEKDKYVKMKENVRNVSEKLEEKHENVGLNSVNSRERDHNFRLQKVQMPYKVLSEKSNFIVCRSNNSRFLK